MRNITISVILIIVIGVSAQLILIKRISEHYLFSLSGPRAT